MDNATRTYLASNPWVEDGKYLLRALEDDEPTGIADVISCVVDMPPGLESVVVSESTIDLSKLLSGLDANERFAIVAMLLLKRSADQVAVALDSTPTRAQKSFTSGMQVCYASFSGNRPWRSGAWLRSVIAKCPRPGRQSLTKLLNMLIAIAEGISDSMDYEMAWEKFSLGGYSALDFEGESIKQSSGYALPAWMDEVSPALPLGTKLVGWSSSNRGPIIVGHGGPDLRVPPAPSGLLSWADAVFYDAKGPIAGIVWLDDDLDAETFCERMTAALISGLVAPFAIVLALPKMPSLSSNNWSSFSMDDTFEFSRETLHEAQALLDVQDAKFSEFQEVWHVYGGVLSHVLVAISANQPPPKIGIWSRSIPVRRSENSVSWSNILG